MTRSSLLALALGAALLAPTANAQTTLTTDVAANSAYMWRGTTMTNQFVLQPDALLTVPVRGWTFLLGAAANVETARYNHPTRDISERGGTSAGVAEFDAWAELSHPVGIATMTFGAFHYAFPNDAGLVAAQNTLEIYGKAAFDLPLAPTVQFWYDTWRVNGSYAEVSLAQELRIAGLPLRVGALAGYNVSQSYSATENEGYFARSGLTHTDLSIATSFPILGVTATPSAHLLLAHDPKTRSITPIRETGRKLWVGVSFGWSHRYGPAPLIPTGDAASPNNASDKH